jgi:hypothetical protein
LKWTTEVLKRILGYTCTVARAKLTPVPAGFFNDFGNVATESISKIRVRSAPCIAAGTLEAFPEL